MRGGLVRREVMWRDGIGRMGGGMSEEMRWREVGDMDML